MGAYGNAFRDARLLSDALAEVFSGRRDMTSALAAYQRARDERAVPD